VPPDEEEVTTSKGTRRMPPETLAEQEIAAAKLSVSQAIESLVNILVKRCNGHEKFSPHEQAFMYKSLHELLAINSMLNHRCESED
jgi:hypothetical protein